MTLTPGIHFSRRGPFDHMKSLWGGYALLSADKRIYFSGDTAQGEHFTEIGDRLGPFDLAIVGIGAYEPWDLMQYAHSTPEQGVQQALEVGAERMVGMHWGTVILADEPPFEAGPRFLEEAARLGVGDRAWILQIGETRAL